MEKIDGKNKVGLEIAKIYPPKSLDTLYKGIEKLSLPSLREEALEKEAESLTELSRVLSVIISISSSPRVLSKETKSIKRASQVTEFSSLDLQETTLDPSMWKPKGGKFAPEWMHTNEHEDNLAIYENLFIIYLLDLIIKRVSIISVILSKSLLKDASNELEKEESRLESLLLEIKRLEKRIRRIKESDFYKRLNKINHNLGHVVPTNILLDDPLYNQCYRCYSKLIRKEKASEDDFEFPYFYLLILKKLKERGFKLEADSNLENATLMANNLNISLNCLQNDGKIAFSASVEGIENISMKAVLLIGEPVNVELSEITTYSLSPLGLIEHDEKGLDVLLSGRKEEDLVNAFLNEIIYLKEGSKELYRRYCPICGKEHLTTEEDESILCHSCSSRYAILEKDGKHLIFILHKGRRD